VSDVVWMAWTFLWLSVLCVGGGVGVIPEMQRQVVANHQWVTAREFVDGYTLAQLTPGPNMLVAAFVGYRAQVTLDRLLELTIRDTCERIGVPCPIEVTAA